MGRDKLRLVVKESTMKTDIFGILGFKKIFDLDGILDIHRDIC